MPNNNKGQAMMETAFAIPILLTLIFGIITIGTFIYDKSVIHMAANRGIDSAIGTMYDPDMDDGTRISKMEETAKNYAKQVIFTKAEPTVDASISDNGNEVEMKVNVKADFYLELPLVSDMFKDALSLEQTAEFTYYKMKEEEDE